MSVVGARPNFMKIAPFCRAIEKHNRQNEERKTNNQQSVYIEHILVHTGQHYDDAMSRLFFEQLSIPEADYDLGIGSGSHAVQVGQTMIAFENVVRRHKPDWIVVVGDVNATCACSIVAKKEHVKLAHIEAGLRSFDEDMPEEVNRVVTDRLTDLYLVPDDISIDNLRNEGVSDSKIAFVGNIMIDTLKAMFSTAETRSISQIIQAHIINENVAFDGEDAPFALVTMHRPSNVDNKPVLELIVDVLINHIAQKVAVLWTIHPRTEKKLKQFGLWEMVKKAENVLLLSPLDYLSMLKLNMESRFMLTDSGGLQEECCILGTPCVVMRNNTERPVTLAEHGGLCYLAGNSPEKIRSCIFEALKREHQPYQPKLWDGETAERCLDAMLEVKLCMPS